MNNPSYTIYKCQINKIKGYEISFTDLSTYSPIVIGFVKNKREIPQLINKHKEEYAKQSQVSPMR